MADKLGIDGPSAFAKPIDRLRKLNTLIEGAKPVDTTIKELKDSFDKEKTRKSLIKSDLLAMTYTEVMELGEEFLSHTGSACETPPALFEFCAWIIRWAKSEEKTDEGTVIP